MAYYHHFATLFLVLTTIQLIKSSNFLASLHGCVKTTWGPNLLYGQGNSFLQLHRRLFGFTSEKECMATMCAPRCATSSSPAQPKPRTLPIESKPTKSTIQVADLRPPNDVLVASPKKVPNGDIKEIQELQALLGPESKLIKDKDGQVIGVEAPNNADSSDRSRPSPQSESQGIPKSDFSICCSTREVFYFNQTLVDYFGRPQVIAQINEMGVYQLIRHGFCGTTGACTGQCDQIYVTLPLVVHPTKAGQQVSFSLFRIPGYCTCRVSALSRRSDFMA